MPTYTYRCKECSHEFDIRQSMKDDALTVCPVCEGPLRRVVGRVGVVFKGSGFYVTDNRGSNGKRKKTTEKTESKSTEKEKSANSTSKTETKSSDTAKSKSD